ncbi:hypothetical protein [Streptomyces aurantiogriseus]|uniref:Uncharacterized protein n=1 Tax=Streptomyces aurantiogriseus TaxID=66870 RepID=A0A918BVU9_9ACTN|nr:hypothetical protein [Streptomyces aurantiogriseus]GGQ95367.1 hypothetical protein GCM10010251_07310 [Streptomyces aurantiogriseus]
MLQFPLSGNDETPGVITTRLGDLVVIFKATPEQQQTQILKDAAPAPCATAEAEVRPATLRTCHGPVTSRIGMQCVSVIF